MTDPSDSSVVVTGLGPMCPEADDGRALAAPRPAAADWFRVEHHLGPRGWRYFTPATRFLLAAAAAAVRDAGVRDVDHEPDARGVVVGTNFASLAVAAAFDRTLQVGGSDALQPMEAPNFSVNIPASAVSIRLRYRAFNLTLTDPLVAGLTALVVGSGAIAGGRAGLALCGATEVDVPSGTAERLGATGASEGACVLAVERASAAAARGAAAYARVGGSFLGNLVGPGTADRFRGWLRRVLPAPPPRPDAPTPYCLTSAPDVAPSLTAAFAEFGPAVGRADPFGTVTHVTVSPVLQAAHLAAAYGAGVVVAGGPDGHVVGLALEPAGGRPRAAP